MASKIGKFSVWVAVAAIALVVVALLLGR